MLDWVLLGVQVLICNLVMTNFVSKLAIAIDTYFCGGELAGGVSKILMQLPMCSWN